MKLHEQRYIYREATLMRTWWSHVTLVVILRYGLGSMGRSMFSSGARKWHSKTKVHPPAQVFSRKISPQVEPIGDVALPNKPHDINLTEQKQKNYHWECNFRIRPFFLCGVWPSSHFSYFLMQPFLLISQYPDRLARCSHCIASVFSCTSTHGPKSLYSKLGTVT